MPNRLIKESICTSDNLNLLSPEEERFFYRLIVNCDDFGRFDGRPAILRAKLFPLKIDSITELDINQWLQGLINAELIFIYGDDKKQFIQVTTWEDHQQIRAKRSKYPDIDSNGYQLISDANLCPRNPIQSNPIRIQSEPRKKRLRVDNTELFNQFWSLYPKKVGKKDTLKAFNKLDLSDGLFDIILIALDKHKQSYEWTKDNGQYIPDPYKWINKERWNDELKPSKNNGNKPYSGIPGNQPAGVFDDLDI